MHLILIDGNNLGFAGMAGTRLSAGDKETQSIFTTIKTIRKIFLDNPEALIMVLWDGRSWRHECAKTFGREEYKANREQTDKQVESRQAYYRQKDDIVLALKLLGITQCFASNMEADDLAEIYSRTWQGDSVTLISGDKDWLQLVNERTIWIDPILNRQCTVKNFTSFTGCKDVAQFIELKSILGDPGDNIKGLKGVGSKTMKKVHGGWDSILDFLNDENKELHWEERIGGNIPSCLDLNVHDVIDVLCVNESLMSLSTVSRPEPINLKRSQEPLDEKGFMNLCNRNAFLSFTRRYEQFLKPFKENKFVKSI